MNGIAIVACEIVFRDIAFGLAGDPKGIFRVIRPATEPILETPMTEHDDFRMPFMVPVRKSSILISKAIRKRKRVYLYPWQMRWLTGINRAMPRWLYDRLLPVLSGQKKDIKPKTL